VPVHGVDTWLKGQSCDQLLKVRGCVAVEQQVCAHPYVPAGLLGADGPHTPQDHVLTAGVLHDQRPYVLFGLGPAVQVQPVGLEILVLLGRVVMIDQRPAPEPDAKAQRELGIAQRLHGRLLPGGKPLRVTLGPGKPVPQPGASNVTTTALNETAWDT
jgi:hypothetical protein